MKKRLLVLTASFLAACALVSSAACTKNIDYTEYVSERRSDVFTYKDDSTEIKIYCSQKEQPYTADGYKGELCDVVEIFVTLPKNPQVLEIKTEGYEGEMNYQAVDKNYYLSFSSPAFDKTGVEVTLTHDGESNTYTALSVKHENVMTCDQAVLCVKEHAAELFESLTKNGLFDGEIYVRLLYDDGCYYYVGICDKTKKINAYLIDGVRGKVIATKTLQG